MIQNIQKQRTGSVAVTIFLVLFSALTTVAIVQAGVVAGVLALVGILVVTVVTLIFSNHRNGFLLTVVYSFFMFHIYRFIPESYIIIPMGVVFDVLLVLVLMSAIIH